MARVVASRVKETSTTTGTGTYNLAGAAAGFRTFVAGVGTGNTCYYCATDGTDFEEGVGTVTDATPDTLARTFILTSSNSNAAVNWGAGTRDIFLTIPAAGLFPPGHIFGLTMSNAVDTANDITVAAGSVRDDTDTVDMRLNTAITKQLDATWAVGTAAGGLNTGAEANSTWYEVHVIMRPDTGVVDVMFTTTANRATLPTNYVYKRRIGWIRNDSGGSILQFTQVDDDFTWTTQVLDLDGTLSTTAAAVTLTVPPSSVAKFRSSITSDATGINGVVFSEIAEGNVAPAISTAIVSLVAVPSASAAGHYSLRVDASSQIERDSPTTDPDDVIRISTYGWTDTRGRLS